MGRNEVLLKEAEALIPGGVNSPVRACRAVSTHPLFLERAEGPHVWDADGRQYIDYVGSWGPLILGHCHPRVVKAIQIQAEKGTTFGAPTQLEIEMARLLVELVPSVQKIRMVNSGTEATMSALRLARAYTGRKMVLKFNGCYHGHVDSLLVKAGSGVATLGIPGSLGVPEEFAKTTLSLPYNDLQAVRKVFQEMGKEIAAVIVEPIAGNMGVVLPKGEFLPGLKELTQKYGALLIFDEVITGFRVSLGGAQELYQIEPDLTCLGKIIGGGLPVGAYGGRKEVMELIAPLGGVYQAGTLSGNPLAMAAGIETIKILKEERPYGQLAQLAKTLFEGIMDVAKGMGVELTVNYIGSMGTVFFGPGPIESYEDAKRADTERFSMFYRAMRKRGICLPPSQFEAWFLSTAHGPSDIEKTIQAFKESLEETLAE